MANQSRYWRLTLHRVKHATGAIRVEYANLEDEDGNALVTAPADLALRDDSDYTVTAGDAAAVIDADLGNAVDISVNTPTAGDPYTLTFTFSVPTLPHRFALALGTGTVGTAGEWVATLFSSDDNNTWAYIKTAPLPFLLGYHAVYRNVVEGYEGDYSRNTHKGGPGGIFGIVLEEDTIKPGGNVVLFERGSWSRVARAVTNATGGYEFRNLTMGTEYYSLATDDNGNPFKDAVGYDHLRPVNAKIKDDLYQTRIAAGHATGALVAIAFASVDYDGANGFFAAPWFTTGQSDSTSEITGALADGVSSVSPKATHDPSLPAVNLKHYGIFHGTPRIYHKQGAFTVEALVAPSDSSDVWVSVIGESTVDDYANARINSFFNAIDRKQYRFLGAKLRITPAGDVTLYLSDDISDNYAAINTNIPLDGSMVHVVFGVQYNGVARLIINGGTPIEFNMAGRGILRLYGFNNSYIADYISGMFIGGLDTGNFYTHTTTDVHASYAALYNRLLSPQEATDLYGALSTPPTVMQLSGYDQHVASAAPAWWFDLQGPDEYIGNAVQALDATYSPAYIDGTVSIAFQVAGQFTNRMAVHFGGKSLRRIVGPGMFASTRERSIVFRMRRAGQAANAQGLIHLVQREQNSNYTSTVALLYIGADDKLTYGISSAYNAGGITYVTFDHVFNAYNQPHHVVVTHDAQTGNLDLWVDRVLRDSKSLLLRLPRGAVTAVIGDTHSTGPAMDSFDGYLADFAGYDRVLTKQEIEDDFIGNT